MAVVVRHTSTTRATARVRVPKEVVLQVGERHVGKLAEYNALRESFRADIRFLKQQGLSYRGIGRVLGYPHTSVIRWLRGTEPINLLTLIAVSRWTRDLRQYLEQLQELRQPQVSGSQRRHTLTEHTRY